jgi:membrane fusion protein, multidrug efflux system
MKTVGKPYRSSRGKIVAIAIIAIAVAVAIYVERRISIRPSTDDATIDADVVHVAAAVGGRIIELPVTENAEVSNGDLLFRIDPEPYRLAVEQAEADLGVAIGALDTRRRAIGTEKSNATIAAEQIKRAQTNPELATRTAERLRPLAGKAYVPTQQFDQAQTAQRDAATSLQQAREQEVAALRAVRHRGSGGGRRTGTPSGARDRTAGARRHDRPGVARWTRSRLDRFIGRDDCSISGVVHFGQHGAVVRRRQLSGNDLHAMAVGDCATVFSMIDRRYPIKGVVEGIGWGVLDEERINLPRAVPYVQRSLNWVRVAQRFPVRVRLPAASGSGRRAPWRARQPGPLPRSRPRRSSDPRRNPERSRRNPSAADPSPFPRWA